MAACHCAGRSGIKKRIFRTEQAALAEAGRLRWYAEVYPCPTKKRRYHLTHLEPTVGVQINDDDRS